MLRLKPGCYVKEKRPTMRSLAPFSQEALKMLADKDYSLNKLHTTEIVYIEISGTNKIKPEINVL